MRDRLIHGYFRVDLEAVWAMIERDLPPLEANVGPLMVPESNSFAAEFDRLMAEGWKGGFGGRKDATAPR